MKNLVAITENGVVVGKVWYNDDEQKESSLVFAGEIAEIIGDMSSEELSDYKNLAAVNADIYGFSFTETRKYK